MSQSENEENEFKRLMRLLADPKMRQMSIDDARTTHEKRNLFRDKRFLRKLYNEYYDLIRRAIPNSPGAILELGSGGSFFKERNPDAITSDIERVPGEDLVASGNELPFVTDSLRAIVMTNVIHHFASAETFFSDAARCVRSGGVIAMIEPWISPWSRLLFRFHYETNRPDMTKWEISNSGPLSGGDLALPWVIFERDAQIFRQRHPEWVIRSIMPGWPLSYVLSGGVSMRSLMPASLFGFVRALERRLPGFSRYCGVEALIVLERA